MNREIKIRVWDIDSSEMITDFNNAHSDYRLDFDKGKLIYVGLIEDNYPQERKSSTMQFTGLLDKNGKEIFEGDVVKRMAKIYNANPTVLSKNLYRYEEQVSFIEYRGNGFWVHDEDFGYEGEDMWNWAEMEIIGNIHQNPELIKTK